MANLETQLLDEVIVSSRRKMLALGGTALAGVFLGGTKAADAQAAAAYTDADILNFALNLEYLEANFYYLGAFGTTIDKPNAASVAAGGPSAGYAIKGVVSTGSANPTAGGAVTTKAGGPAACQVPTTVALNPSVLTSAQLTAIGSYLVETAIEEGKHVNFLYTALGAGAVAQPPINLDGGAASPSTAAFNTLASAAGLGSTFDPFANLANFLLGAYVFEDVGVTAYHGAAPLITQTATGKTYLQAAAGILAVEAYHAGLIRTTMNGIDGVGSTSNGSLGLIAGSTAVSKLRSTLANQAISTNPAPGGSFDANPDDYGLATTSVSLAGAASVTASNIVDAQPVNIFAFARSTTEVLNIVTGGGAISGTAVVSPAKGVFYPAGMNGLFK